MATAFLVDGDGIDSSISSNEDFEESKPRSNNWIVLSIGYSSCGESTNIPDPY